MKSIQLFFIFLLFASPIFSNNYNDAIKKNTSITGQVIDKQTGEPLTGVSIKLTGLNLTVYTDFDGNFSVNNVFPGKYDVMVSMLTYKKINKEKVSVENGKTNYLKIELESVQ